MKVRLIVLICVSVFLVGLPGCVAHHSTTIEVGKSPDERAVSQITIGKTTRSDLFRTLGTPHSIFQGQVEFKKTQLVGFFLHSENRFLTTWNDKQYAVLYRAGKVEGREVVVSAVIITVGNTNVKVQSDELLLFLNKDTHIVEDFAYRKETRS
ncbi:MAG TPA: hypothetical protein VJ646_18725 [Candidatus Binatia bacterium]|nr:hypothetical protein [Candidatus Binatia bacterium]